MTGIELLQTVPLENPSAGITVKQACKIRQFRLHILTLQKSDSYEQIPLTRLAENFRYGLNGGLVIFLLSIDFTPVVCQFR
jgi:hypothetical protein